jgi:FtsZ-binding cell division protein ZapB
LVFFVFDGLTHTQTNKTKTKIIFNDVVASGELRHLRMSSSSSSPPVRAVEPFSSSLGGDLFGEDYDNEVMDELDDVDVDAAASSTAKQPVRFSSPSPVKRPTVGNKGVPRTGPPTRVPPPPSTKPVVSEERVSKEGEELFLHIINVLKEAGEKVVMKNFRAIMGHIFDLCRPQENVAVKDSKGARMLVINRVVQNSTELKNQLSQSLPVSPFMAWLGEVVRILPLQHQETARKKCTVEAFTTTKKSGGPKSSAKTPKVHDEEEEKEDSSDDDDDDDDVDDSSGEEEELVSESPMVNPQPKPNPKPKPKPAPVPPPTVPVSKKRPADAMPAGVLPPPQKVQRTLDDEFETLLDEIGSKFKDMKQTVSVLKQENCELKDGSGPLQAENKKLAADNQALKAKNKKLSAMIEAFINSERDTD